MNAELARQIQDYASARYDAGWDYIVECYEISDLIDLFARWGIKNLDAAIEHFTPIVAIRNERLADARYEADAGSGEPAGDDNTDSAFQSWLLDVDAAMINICGIGVDDLEDQYYRNMFDSGLSPQEAAETVLEDEGFTI